MDLLALWTTENLMKLKEAKAKYFIFSRTQQQFARRLTVDGKIIERQKLLVFGWTKMKVGTKTLTNFVEMFTPE